MSYDFTQLNFLGLIRGQKNSEILLLHKACEVSAEVTFVIAPLDKMSKQADKAHAQDAVPMMYSKIMFQPEITKNEICK